MYELYYWPEIPGRGEFVRLVLEDCGLPYRNITDIEDAGEIAPIVFAVPALRDGDNVISQTVAITRYLGERHGLAPPDERGRLAALSVAMTIADLVTEVHDTHHPASVEETYEKQKPEAARRAKVFRDARLPKFLGYLERMLGHDRERDGRYLVGDACSYADLAAFHAVAGLRYAFPNAMARQQVPKLLALHDRIAERPRLAEYLASPRHLAFNEMGIFRHYPELDP